MNASKILSSLGLIAALASTAPAKSGDICVKTAKLQLQSARFELKEEFKVDFATCLNLTDPFDRFECILESFGEYGENKQLAKDQFEARLELCEKLEGGPSEGPGGAYDPEIDPADFSTVVDNPYLPFPYGAMWEYTSETDEGTETITVEVLPPSENRVIMGVECISVRDVVMLEGEPIEDTVDWYAQDSDGNVWYFGEISFSFEDGYVANIEGSWLTGEDGAKPGIVMLGTPTVGTTYRQEWLLGDAEDAATVEGVAVSVSFGDPEVTFPDCVQTADFLPPDPDAHEHKWYAYGIGFVYETKEDSDETVDLVSSSLPMP